MGTNHEELSAELLPAKRIEAVLDEGDQLCRILGKSVATAKGNAARMTKAAATQAALGACLKNE